MRMSAYELRLAVKLIADGVMEVSAGGQRLTPKKSAKGTAVRRG